MEEKLLKLEMKVERLESLVNSLITKINLDKFYSDADISGVRKATSDITPYTETKTAYIDDTSIVFTDVPDGNLTVCFDKPLEVLPKLSRESGKVTLEFEPLNEVNDITISII